MLTLRAVENDGLDADKQDDIPLEQIRDAEGENAENIPPPGSTTKRGRKKKQPEIEEPPPIQQKDTTPEQSISVPEFMVPTPLPPPLGTSLTENFHMAPPTPSVPDLVPPMSVSGELPLSMYPPPQTPLQQIEDIPADQLHSLLENAHHPLMENMGYDQNNPLMANMGYDDQHPATTPGAVSDKGQATPWNDDYDFPHSAGPPEEQQTDETYEQFEERVLNKRAAHMYQILKSRFARQTEIHFSEMTHRNNKKQVSQKFYTLLVMKKAQVLELEQESAFEELVITKGASYENPTL